VTDPRSRPPRRRASNRRRRDANLADWDRSAGLYERLHRRSLTREGGRAWGLWRVPERRLKLLDDVRGEDVLELGCGAAWWSIALARDGARVVGLDFSSRRLAQARARVRRAGVVVPLVRARAEAVPFASGSFDLVLSDYGATTFSDPYRTIPEAARVLRPAGLLVFAHASPFRTVAHHAGSDRMRPRLQRSYFELHQVRFGATREFNLAYGEWIRLFGSVGLSVERLVELPAPRHGSTYVSRPDLPWARRWPMEAIWRVRKTRVPSEGTPLSTAAERATARSPGRRRRSR